MGILFRNLYERGDAIKEFLLAWGCYKGILMSVGTLLRNFNECGDTIKEF